jgi:hypothetical protein
MKTVPDLALARTYVLIFGQSLAKMARAATTGAMWLIE